MGTYSILMRFINPLTAIKPNAKQLRFANSEQDNHQDGWLSLKTFQVNSLDYFEIDNESELLIY